MSSGGECLYTILVLLGQVFHGSDRTGVVKVNETNAVYQFRMSAVAVIGGIKVEGDLSEATAQSFILVPKPGTVFGGRGGGTAHAVLCKVSISMHTKALYK